MTKEEKAKAYDEALDRMKHVVIVPKDEKALQALKETIFPQLRESEDEKVRQGMIHFLESEQAEGIFTYEARQSWIAYLEKQKDNQYFIGYAKGYSDGQLNPKQKEESLRDFIDDFPYSAQKEQKPELVQQPPITYTYPSDASRDERLKAALIALLNSDLIKVAGNKFTKQDLIEWVERIPTDKPAESISHLTVQGKGVYKICPRCKERMVRDDSKVYTSMPPQYGYECPKCGEMEFDTVMYDNPEMEEKKSTEWSKNDTVFLKEIIDYFENKTVRLQHDLDMYAHWLKSLPKRFNLQSKEESCNYITPNKEFFQWVYDRLVHVHKENPNVDYMRSFKERINNLSFEDKHQWKPSEEQMDALNALNCHGDLSYVGQQNQLISLYNDLKKLM